MTIPEAVLIALITAVATSLVQPLVQGWIGKRKQVAESKKTLAEAGSADAGTTNIIVESSGKVIQQWQGAYNEMKEQSELSRQQIAALDIRVDYLTQKMERVLRAFRYLANEVESDYPEAVKIARQIAAVDNDDDVIPAPKGKTT